MSNHDNRMSSVERRSVFIDYASGAYSQPIASPLAYVRARSLTREASIARIHKLDHVDCAYYHHRMKSLEKDLNVYIEEESQWRPFVLYNSIYLKEASSQLEHVNKDYHNMHANFMHKQLQDKHYIGNIEEHVSHIKK